MSEERPPGDWTRAGKLFSSSARERAEFVEWVAERLNTTEHFLPKTRKALVDWLVKVRDQRALFDAEALGMLEGVLRISELTVRDVLIPSADVTRLTTEDSLETVVSVVAESGHSRYPVFDGKGERVVGVLLAKDLLRFFRERAEFRICDVMRPPVFEPMSKRLDVLLKEFRHSKNHMVIVVDEYDTPAGLVTIEDVLECIVGSISDEYDDDTRENIDEIKAGRLWRVRGLTPLEEFGEHFGVPLSADGVETVGGWISQQFGLIPRRGESVKAGPLVLRVEKASTRRVLEVEVERPPQAEAPDAPAEVGP